MVSLKWDVSEHQKDQRSSMTGDASGTDRSNASLVKIVKSTLSIPFELPTVPGAFPPQPVDSPATPPLTSLLPLVITAASTLPLSRAPHPPSPALLEPHAILSSSSFASTISTIAAVNGVSTFNLHPCSILALSVVAYQNGPVLTEIGGNPSIRVETFLPFIL